MGWSSLNSMGSLPLSTFPPPIPDSCCPWTLFNPSVGSQLSPHKTTDTLCFVANFMRQNMGCGNSSPTSPANDRSSCSKVAHPEGPSKVSDDAEVDDDKRKNFGGVYVGLPTDVSNIPTVQIGSLRESERDSVSLRKPLWGNGQ